MTKEEMYAGAILALKMIANVKPHVEHYEWGFNNIEHTTCKQCKKMNDLAVSALEELLEETKDD
jgi:hypothetical protein